MVASTHTSRPRRRRRSGTPQQTRSGWPFGQSPISLTAHRGANHTVPAILRRDGLQDHRTQNAQRPWSARTSFTPTVGATRGRFADQRERVLRCSGRRAVGPSGRRGAAPRRSRRAVPCGQLRTGERASPAPAGVAPPGRLPQAASRAHCAVTAASPLRSERSAGAVASMSPFRTQRGRRRRASRQLATGLRRCCPHLGALPT